MEASLTGMWVNFFTAAGIPSDVGATYALTFTDNRIQTDMLLELNKEYLRDMGITRMGDVIAILRHAKLVHENAARDRVLNTASPKVPIAAVTGRLTATQAKPSSPASRMLEHYTRNPQPAELPQVSSKITIKRRITDASRGTTDDAKKVRHIEINTGEAVRPAAAPAAKQTVFSRLGGAPETVGEVVSKAADVKTIFSRLGNKSLTVNFGENKRSVQHEERGEPLQYEGILKSQTEFKKVVINTVKPTPVRKSVTVGTMRADEAPISVKQKLAISKSKSVKFSNHIDYKEIEPIPKKRVFFESVSTAAIKIREAENPVFNKPERRLMKPTPINNPDVKARLGAKPEAQVIQRNVFNRLGGGNP